MAAAFFSAEEQERIIEAIRSAEHETSGEIRLHVEPACAEDAYERAKQVFDQLGMGSTELKNGVLFYLAYEDKKFAVIGDSGIHEKVQDTFWNETKALMEAHFKDGHFVEGICRGIEMAGQKLIEYFPYKQDDKDELSNDISFGDSKDV